MMFDQVWLRHDRDRSPHVGESATWRRRNLSMANAVPGRRSPTPPPEEPLFLNCPRCGLSLKPRRRWLAIEHCPRCLARARVPVRMFSSPLPARELYAAGAAPDRRLQDLQPRRRTER